MKMTQSEKTYVRTAIVVIGLAMVWLFIVNPLRISWLSRNEQFDNASARFSEARNQIKIKEGLDKSLAEAEKAMGVKVPTVPPDAQISNLVKELETTGGKNGVQFKNLTPRSISAGSRQTLKAGSPISFQTNFEVGPPKLAPFLADLEAMTVPLVIKSLDVQYEPAKPDKLRVSLDCYTYIFY